MWFILFLAIEEVSYYMSKEGCPTPGCRGVGNAKGRISEKMSWKELAIFLVNLAYTAHIRQNHSNYVYTNLSKNYH